MIFLATIVVSSFCSCTVQDSVISCSVFEYKPNSKEELEKRGFQFAAVKDLKTGEITQLSSLLKKKINDTTIQFNYSSDNKLISKLITLQLDKIDTLKLLSNLYLQGYKKMPSKMERVKFDLINYQKGISYSVFIGRREIGFELLYTKDVGKQEEPAKVNE